MASNTNDPGTEQLLREICHRTGETTSEAIRTALEERLERLPPRERTPAAKEQLYEILHHIDALPVIDFRSEDEILGYDENGIPR